MCAYDKKLLQHWQYSSKQLAHLMGQVDASPGATRSSLLVAVIRPGRSAGWPIRASANNVV
jgi:hypothetical protein